MKGPAFRSWARAAPWRTALGAAAVVAIGAALALLPLRALVLQLAAWAHGAGWRGAGLYVLGYALLTPLLAPGSMLSVGAGFAFGPLLGFAVAWPGAVLGATLAFLLGRTAARERVQRRFGHRPQIAALDAAAARNGFRTVLLLRLSPLFPFTFVNYALSLTRVRLRDFVLGTAVGIVPGMVVYVYSGSLVTQASALVSGAARPGGAWAPVLLGLGLVATVAVAVLLTRAARRELARLLDAERG